MFFFLKRYDSLFRKIKYCYIHLLYKTLSVIQVNDKFPCKTTCWETDLNKSCVIVLEKNQNTCTFMQKWDILKESCSVRSTRHLDTFLILSMTTFIRLTFSSDPFCERRAYFSAWILCNQFRRRHQEIIIFFPSSSSDLTNPIGQFRCWTYVWPIRCPRSEFKLKKNTYSYASKYLM